MKTIGCLFLLLALSGCSLNEIKSQTKVLEGAALVHGKVVNHTPHEGPLNVLVFEYIDGLPHYDAALYASDSGHYQFHVTPGRYHIASHVDINRDGKYQDKEPLIRMSSPEQLNIAAGDTIQVDTLKISLAEQSTLDIDTSVANSSLYDNFGKVAPLASPIFKREHYSLGLWRPMDFLNSVGGGLYMLEEYAPDKIPVLFVHGISGGPNDWKSIIEQIDTSRFQPWVFYYASGIQLDIVSETLYQAVAELQKRHGFRDLIIAAHSMGGLVTRSYIKKYDEQYSHDRQLIKLVVTVNSPFGGMESAAKGVKMSPIVVQSWKDVALGSEFLTALNQWQWPDRIPYHLAFSYSDGHDGDGIVSLRNQLPYELQRDASQLHGYADTHVGTLSNPKFMSLFNQLLADTQSRLQGVKKN